MITITQKVEWKSIEIGPNLILQGEDFYISYNPNTGNSHGVFTKLGNLIGELAGEKVNLTDGEETALKHKTGEWLILVGDFRKEYEKAFPKGYEACKEVYEKHKKSCRSNWSTDELTK